MCVTRQWRCAWSALCGADLDDLLGEGEIEPGVEVVLGLGGVGALAEGPGGAGEGDGVEPVEVAAQVVPGLAGGGLDDADEQQREWPSPESVETSD